MVANKAADRALTAWAKEFLKKLPHDVRVLTRMAEFDLLYGPLDALPDMEPYSEEGVSWVGFYRAIEIVGDYFDCVGDLWVDTNAELVENHEPAPWVDENGELVEPYWEDYYKVERHEALRYLVGDLGEYL